MKDYLITVGSVIMLVSFSQMLLSDGGMKKFASLAAGFIIIAAISSPLNGHITIPDTGGIKMDGTPDYEAAYRAEVLKRHRDNLRAMIKEHMKYGGNVYVETDTEGNITKITLLCRGDESAAVLFITNELKVPRERIIVKNENN